MEKHTARRRGLPVLLLIASALHASCSDADSPTGPSTDVSLTITIEEPQIAVYETIPLSATVIDDNGEARPAADVAWSVSDPSIASIDADAVLTAHGAGTVTLTARWNDLSATTDVDVHGFMVGPDGGSAWSDDGRVQLDIPPGALADGVVISVEPASAQDLQGLPTSDLVAGTAYDLLPHGQTFAADVELTLTYDPAHVPSGHSENALRVARAEGGAWNALPGGVDVSTREATGETGHFSVYGVVATDTPSGSGGGPANPPVATITAPADGSSFAAGTSVSFAGTGDDPQDGTLSGASLVWTSDLDGSIGIGTSFSSSSLSIGTHTVTLAATDTDGGTGTDQITVTITNNDPTASITAPADGSSYASGASVSFTGTGTDPEDGALGGGSLVWTSDLDGQIGTGTSFSNSSLSIGVHTITLTATDSNGGTGTDQITVTITNNDPTASITGPADGSSYASGASVSFTGTGTDVEDGALTGGSLVWTSDLDGQIGTGTSFSNSSLSIGVHTITLTATDSNGGTGTDQITVTITNNDPTASITAPADGSSFASGASVSFTGTGTDVEDGALTGGSLVWTSDLDGQIGTGTSFSTTTLSIGVHTITLTATDSNGGTGTDQITVTIT